MTATKEKTFKRTQIYKNYEYTIRRKDSSEINAVTVSNSEDVFEYLKSIRPSIPDIMVQESFIVIALNTQNVTQGWMCLSTGTDSYVTVSMKMAMLFAIESMAASIIVAHNHPSGELTPSESDKKITQKIKNSCEMLDIRLLDHLVYSQDKFFSFSSDILLSKHLTKQ